MDDVGTMRNVVLMVRHAAGGHPHGPTPGQAVAAMKGLRETFAQHCMHVDDLPDDAGRRQAREHRTILDAIRRIGDGPYALAEAHGAAMLLRDHLLWEERLIHRRASTAPRAMLEA